MRPIVEAVPGPPRRGRPWARVRASSAAEGGAPSPTMLEAYRRSGTAPGMNRVSNENRPVGSVCDASVFASGRLRLNELRHRIDEGQVGECLGKVPKMVSGVGVDLFGIEMKRTSE